jgi:hypothetical protein
LGAIIRYSPVVPEQVSRITRRCRTYKAAALAPFKTTVIQPNFPSRSENILAKSQKKSSREIKKPKKDKKAGSATPSPFLTPPHKK